MAKYPYNGPWPRIRLSILERDNYRCQIDGPNCTAEATQVDHIIPWEQGGAPYDPDNLRASCRRCNIGRRNTLHNNEGWRTSPSKITLVYGPPGAGKSTYAQQHKAPADLVVDYDLIGHALGSNTREQHQQHHDVINAARNAIIGKIRRGETGAPHIWLISTHPQAPTMFPHHEAVLLKPDREVAAQRAIDGGRTTSALHLLDRWYEPEAMVNSRHW